MKKLKFTLSTKLTFDNNVHEHSFALRCIPIENQVQKILNYDLSILPFAATQKSVDSFGNTVVSGYLKNEHRFLDFEISGIAEIDISQKVTDFMPCYKYQSNYTKPGKELEEFYNKVSSEITDKDPMKRTEYFSNKLSEIFEYKKSSTTIKTTAEEAFAQKCGVCQDYSHIMISLLRKDGIAARYKAGLASCDGETHSWIEIWNADHWEGFDPANNCPADESYLCLSQGRDFSDCSIDRGVMFGAYTNQMQLITSNLQVLYY